MYNFNQGTSVLGTHHRKMRVKADLGAVQGPFSFENQEANNEPQGLLGENEIIYTADDNDLASYISIVPMISDFDELGTTTATLNVYGLSGVVEDVDALIPSFQIHRLLASVSLTRAMEGHYIGIKGMNYFFFHTGTQQAGVGAAFVYNGGAAPSSVRPPLHIIVDLMDCTAVVTELINSYLDTKYAIAYNTF